MKFRAFLAALALAVAPVAYSAEAVKTAAAYNIDVDSGVVTYFRHVGLNNDPFGGSLPGLGTIETSGSSTTVVESVASSGPFADIGVGDVLEVVIPATGTKTLLRVEAKASAASITVDTAVNLGTAGVAWRYFKLQSGTTNNDGWFSVSGATSFSIGVYWFQGDLDALLVRWECRSHAIGALPQILFPGATSECGISGDSAVNPGFCTTLVADLGILSAVTLNGQFSGHSECRVGMAFSATDTADAVGVSEEIVKITVDVLTSTP